MTDREKEAIEYFSREVNEKQWIESNFNVSERNKLRAILKFIKKTRQNNRFNVRTINNTNT